MTDKPKRVQFELTPEEDQALSDYMQTERIQRQLRGVRGWNNRMRVLLLGLLNG